VIIKVPPDTARDLWFLAETELSKVLPFSQGEMDLQYMKERVLYEESTLWIAGTRGIDVWMITEIMPCGKIQVLQITAIAGKNLKEHAHEFERNLIEYARIKGCDRIQAWGRPGWIRYLKTLFPNVESNRVLLTLQVDP
jgi:hypothetical protein